MPQAEALFNITPSHTVPNLLLMSFPVLRKTKRKIYLEACSDRRAMFTPLCTSVDGLLGREANVFVKRIAERLSYKWNTNYGQVLGWIRTHLSFSILRATVLCLRGSHTKWRSINVVDSSPHTHYVLD